MATILIVDDKESNLRVLRQVLQGLDGVEIIQALSGDAALRACLNHDFALAILDVQMPVMDGYELAALLRGDPRTKAIPIIFLSAVYFDDLSVFKGYNSGAVDFITKPFNPTILLSKVKVFLMLDSRKAEVMRQNSRLEELVAQLEQQMEARKKAEQELLKARMLEAVGTLAGGIAHDFNNMLTVLVGQLELAQMHSQGNPRVCQLLDDAHESVLRATDLTTKFITFSGGGRPFRKSIPTKPMLNQSVAEALAGADLEVDFAFDEELWNIQADRRQLKQVIYVLVTNAREAMAANGGSLKVTAVNWLHKAGHEATGLTVKEGPYVKVSISDQGPGIAAENLPKVFDPYFSTKSRGSIKGMGLGLTIAHSIITKHGGSIQVESPPGAGASFHLYLPAAH